MSIWIGIAIACVLLLLGLLGLAIGALIVIQQLRKRRVNQVHRAKKLAELRQLPHRATQIVSGSQRPTMPLQPSPVAIDRGRAGDPAHHPTLAPEDEEPEVPTAVFRPSQYKDIEALLKDADKYVEKHKK